MRELNDYQLRQIAEGAFVGATADDARLAREELARRELDDEVERSQREGYCFAVDEECLTHNCAPAWPCGKLTCPHCRGDDGREP